MVALTALYWQFALYAAPVLAKASGEDPATAAVNKVTDGTTLLYDIVAAGAGGVGVLFLAWGGLDFAAAFSAGQTSEQNHAVKKVIGGIIACAVGLIVKALK